MQTSAEPAIHPDVEPIAYREEIRFWHVGKPFLAYAQRTWALDDGRPLHGEMGYWRSKPGGAVEISMAHPTGIVEIQEGRLEGTTIRMASTVVGLTSTAKEVTRLERTVVIHGDALTYDVSMAAVGQPLTHHLHAVLRRDG
jgi:THAP4-like, heme-binding beta-barrel domain